MTRLAGLVALCAALAPVPLLRATPGFARGAREWLALGAAALLAALIAAALGALLAPSARRRGASLALGAWALALAALAAAAGWTPAPAPPHPLVLVGIDGAGWPQVERLRAEGRLPTFDALVARGARAELRTLDPVLSPPIWTSIASGVGPERHGVIDFWTSSEAVRAKRIWEVADERGLSSGVFGYLVTWPPRKRGGFLVPGFLAGDTRTLPPELAFVKRLESRSAGRPLGGPLAAVADLLAALRHGATLGALGTWAGESLADAGGDERRLGILALETDVFCQLLRRQAPDLAVFYQNHVDAVSHLYYQYFEPGAFDAVIPADVERFGERIPRIYEASDASLARILACAPAHANLVVVSDHGQQPAARAGRPFWTVRSAPLLRALGLDAAVRATHVGEAVFLRPASPGVEMERVAGELRGVVTDPGGEPAFEVRPRSASGLVFRALRPPRRGEYLRMGALRAPIGDVIQAAGRQSGEHSERALLLMAGPDVAPGAVVEGASVLDVAPTVAALLRLPVARDLAGRVLDAALRPGLEVARIESWGEPEGSPGPEGELGEAARERLRSLGYVQ